MDAVGGANANPNIAPFGSTGAVGYLLENG